ncbi:MFS transporter [Streptomyces humidus]|uniref:MFS transporter n=1 Tax=Streptomyces humidus TaxID=52259 RepID=A0A918FSF6_9ACTN|nr:MFS transporter [Streptomyces humidus]GGR77030.1 MFS transporter [Streptomyces humidus]
MSRLRNIGILAAVILPSFMTALDSTAVNVALPQIQRELGLDESALKWVAAIYPLTHASSLLFGGHLADRKGRRLTLTLGVVVFTVSSVLCSASNQAGALIAGRGMQGAGAALISPASLAVLSHDLPPRARSGGIAALTVALASALAGGPVLSGLITQHLGWNWLFVINIPVGVVCLLFCAAYVPSPVSSPASQVVGVPTLPLRVVAFVCLPVGGLSYCFIQAPRDGFGSPHIAIVGIISVLSLLSLPVLAMRPSSRRRSAVRVLFGQRAFTGGIISQLLWGLGISGVYFFTTLFMQNVLRLSPTSAGLLFTPVALTLLMTAPFVAHLARRWGDGRVSASGLFLVSMGLLLVALGSGRHDALALVPGLAAIGVGSALAVPLTTRALESSPDGLSGIAAGLFGATREASGVFGIAVVGLIVTFVQRSVSSTSVDSEQAFLIGYQTGLCAAAALVATGVPIALWALRRHVCPQHGCCAA